MKVYIFIEINETDKYNAQVIFLCTSINTIWPELFLQNDLFVYIFFMKTTQLENCF